MGTRVQPTVRALSGAVSCFGGFVLFGVACQSTPDATPDGPAVTGGSSSIASTTPSGASATSTPPSADACAELRKAVVAEASTLASCETNADCVVHRIGLCHFDELDCYSAHVHKGRSTASFDKAVGAYSKGCEVARCRCERPSKSVCRSGKCTAE
jgi:hypothetical protein